MAHMVESMFSVGVTPWHGLGKVLPVAPKNRLEALQFAELDNWNLRLEQLYMADGTKVDRYIVVRGKDGAKFDTVSSTWKIISNEKAFEPIDPFIESGAATIETAGSLRGGKRVWLLAKLNRADSIIVDKADDKVQKYLLIAVGHDGTLTFRIGFTPIRVVCNNTLSVALTEGESTCVKIRHTKNAHTAIDDVKAAVEAIDARFEETAKVFRALASKQVNTNMLRSYVDAVFAQPKQAKKTLDNADTFAHLMGKAHMTQDVTTGIGGDSSNILGSAGIVTEDAKSRVFGDIVRLFESGRGNDVDGVRGTAWAAYNAITEYNSWERGATADNRMNNVWLAQSGPVGKALPVAVQQFLG